MHYSLLYSKVYPFIITVFLWNFKIIQWGVNPMLIALSFAVLTVILFIITVFFLLLNKKPVFTLITGIYLPFLFHETCTFFLGRPISLVLTLLPLIYAYFCIGASIKSIKNRVLWEERRRPSLTSISLIQSRIMPLFYRAFHGWFRGFPPAFPLKSQLPREPLGFRSPGR